MFRERALPAPPLVSCPPRQSHQPVVRCEADPDLPFDQPRTGRPRPPPRFSVGCSRAGNLLGSLDRPPLCEKWALSGLPSVGSPGFRLRLVPGVDLVIDEQALAVGLEAAGRIRAVPEEAVGARLVVLAGFPRGRLRLAP